MHEQQTSTDTLTRSRSTSPDSPLASSLFDATANIDDLTNSLANFSRVDTPEPAAALTCCCGKEDCEHLKAWQAFKAKLESRLILSAEVGQALLQRHEAYVRRVQSYKREHHQNKSGAAAIESLPSERVPSTKEELEIRVAELVKENAVLEKRFNQALLNSEVAESSNKTLTLELQEVRDAVSRLSTEHARSVGWETRMRNLRQERDDLQQERDNEAQKARITEARLSALNDKCALLRTQVSQLQEDLDQQQQHRTELSEEILQDARGRLQELSLSRHGRNTLDDHDEVTKIMETLVADNESLMKSNAELQRMLGESRETVNSLQEEAEEYRASLRTSIVRDEASFVRHRRTQSNQSMFSTMQMSSSSAQSSPHGTASVPPSPVTYAYPLHGRHHSVSGRRPASIEPPGRRRYQEPLTPETTHHPLFLSPDHSILPSKAGSRSQPVSPLLNPHDLAEDDKNSRKPRIQRPLPLLTRSRGVQTDQWAGLLSPLPSTFDQASSSASPHDGQSESSSLAENPSTLSILLERISVLFTRLSQADALTLTNRLKRQHLVGADVSHLSRTTVDAIIADVTNLRTHFRSSLEDERIVTTCTRKDLRSLFKILREVFQEMGSMRVTLNDVVLDPSLAPKIREIALNPSMADTTPRVERDNNANSNAAGWMAPLTKLFGAPAAPKDKGPSPLMRSNSRGQAPARSARLVPKIAPAASASTTTVNVEFSGTGLGRAVTSTSTPSAATLATPSIAAPRPQPALPSRKASQNVMGIFRGAPTPSDSSLDPWVVIPNRRAKTPGGRPSRLPNAAAGTGPTDAAAISPVRSNMARMSRNVDAMLDRKENTGFNATLQRTLRPRGLSDSSIHTTYIAHDTPTADEEGAGREAQPIDVGENSVLQALSRKVQDFKTAAANSFSGASTPFPTSSPPVPSHIRNLSSGSGSGTLPRTRSPRPSGLLPDLTSWATAGETLDRPDADRPFVGSPRTRENTGEYLGRPL